MKQLKQNGFAAVEALLIVVIVAIVAGTGYFVWHAKQNTDNSLTDTASSQPAIAKSKKQTTGQATTAPTPTASNDLVIKEWGIKIPNGTSDTFTYSLNGAYAQLSTAKLTTADADCSATKGPAIGVIQRASANDQAFDDGTTAAQAYQQKKGTVAHVGNYYYVYTAPDAGCSATADTNTLQNNTILEIRALVPLAEATN